MTRGFFARLSARFHRFFPERQFYHRSHGEVHFVSLSGRTQFFYLTITLGFLTWVGYASVNVVFKEQIISEKERNFVVMQKQYEQRVSDMQISYDEINSVLILAEQNFQESTRQLEERHEQLRSLVEMKQALNEKIDSLKDVRLAKNKVRSQTTPGTNTVVMGPTERDPSSRQSRRTDFADANPVQAVTTALGQMFRGSVSAGDVRNSLAARVAALEERVNQLRDGQQDLINELEEDSQYQTALDTAIIDKTGLGFDQVIAPFEDEAGGATGGPFIALKDMDVDVDTPEDESESAFRKQLLRLANKLDELDVLQTALTHIPLTKPVNDKPNFEHTSGFGPRIDPFSRRKAFHSGMDMPGQTGTTIVATAPGVVTYAGLKGPYGNMVEIDHGYGFKTRYGHLQKVLVKKGDKVGFYQKIALMGSTGRSTGPHLHYEVLFHDKVKDPAKFFEAGNYVFKE